MVAVTTYAVTAERGRHRWLLQCDQYPGALSEVARLDQAADVMREAVAFVAQLPETEIDIEVRPALPDEVATELAEVRQIREQIAAMEHQATQRRKQLAALLHEQGLTVRDIGTVLGVSYQRAHQLLA